MIRGPTATAPATGGHSTYLPDGEGSVDPTGGRKKPLTTAEGPSPPPPYSSLEKWMQGKQASSTFHGQYVPSADDGAQ